MTPFAKPTICGAPLEAFANQPTPRELGRILAGMRPEAVAATLSEWQGAMRYASGNVGEAYQLTRYAASIRAHDEELGDSDGAGCVGDLGAAIGNVTISNAA